MYQRYRIAIFMTWFGPLPDYFPYWLRSAEMNSSIDFICICDQLIESNAENIKVIRTDMQTEIRHYEKILQRKIRITAPYKFCDCRAFFGILYSELLNGYDFWGYCDIDLVFGDIRKFVTDEVLSCNDRIYEFGHLSLYRNDEKTLQLYQLDGSIYTMDEVFESSAKVTYEEFYGINRICRKNKIPWYTNRDFVDFSVLYPRHMEQSTPHFPYRHQVYFWENGHAYCLFEKDGKLQKDEYVYMHFQKRKLVPAERNERDKIEAFYLGSEKIIKKEPGYIPTIEEMDVINPPISRLYRLRRRVWFFFHRWALYFSYDKTQREIKMRGKLASLGDLIGEGEYGCMKARWPKSDWGGAQAITERCSLFPIMACFRYTLTPGFRAHRKMQTLIFC